MPRRNWKTFRPTSLLAALEGSIDFAREKHNRSVDNIADLLGLASKWTLYKWLSNGAMPANMIAGFEHACGCHFVTSYLSASAGKLVIDFPTGRLVGTADIQETQAVCHGAVGALLAFSEGKQSADDTKAALLSAIERLAYEHAQVHRHQQPELDL
ncbi:MAG: hypothetical protein MK141_14170 [Pseudoxanthomonas sp.]|jgi:hypothetical protein|uniref:hypothetical protein n=1 Tax=Pseudoxanthomonas sp. TaxID=1871049 RepID=UPI00258A6AA9|nr:hypothetical protein [Pseudoxanthomonas sp.]MCH2092705.1 hypothetical protein [Pseudoxanthomonas sp.]